MNQPNLQTIMNGLVNFGKNCYKRDGEYLPEMNRSEAIDAIYAGLLAEVIGPDITDERVKHTDPTHIHNGIKAEQRKALKRWCYGGSDAN